MMVITTRISIFVYLIIIHVYQNITVCHNLIRASGHALQFFIRKFCRGG